jgi:triosephosphate isomerase
MRKPVIAGNWKLFKTSSEAVELVTGLLPLVAAAKNVEIVVAPVFTVLDRVHSVIANSNVKLSAQDCYWEAEGAFTGEISPKMLLDAGCSHVIIGHSERRQYFGETDETVNKKIKAAIASGLVVLFCIGETLAERESGKTFDVLKRQIIGGLAGIPESDLAQVIVAYEPVWAIGTGRTATAAQAQEAHAFLRGRVMKKDAGVAARLPMLYGGSVKGSNAAELFAMPDVDGGLIGGASLVAEDFLAIWRAAVAAG